MRATLSGTLAIVLVAVLVADDGGPASELAADRQVVERAEGAAAALTELERALQPALEAARRGAARIVAGDASPAEKLGRAADASLEAEDAAAEVRTALRRLAAALRTRQPAAEVVEAPLPAGTLDSIAGHLRATADAGEAFAAMRHRADLVTESLDAALAALERGDLDAAEEATATARRTHDAIREWDLVLATLPVWLETTDAMIDAMETILAATRAGDAAAARDAAERFAALADEAETADRALRIAIAEGGAAVSAVALGRLADALAAVADARAEVAAILHSERR